MKKSASIIILWLLGVVMAQAVIPKADLSVATLNSGQWPADYQLTLTIPKEHHAYLDKGDENIYIPVTVDPEQKLAASQLTITNLQKPVGVYDSVVKATVLRDKGDFIVSLALLGYRIDKQQLSSVGRQLPDVQRHYPHLFSSANSASNPDRTGCICKKTD